MMDWKEKRLWKKRGNGFLWDWCRCEHFIIDDSQPEIDWSGFDWEFFNQYGGVNYLDKYDVYQRIADPLSDELKDFICLEQSPFYPWFGGECPVPANCEVEVIWRNGDEFKHLASDVDWKHYNIDYREDADAIIAFRLTGKVL